MKKVGIVVWLALLYMMAGCEKNEPSTPVEPTTVTPTVVTTVPPQTTVPPTVTEPQPTQPQPPILMGWQQEGDNTYFYLTDGRMATGWVEIQGLRYYFGDDGAMCTGWLQRPEGRYYLGDDGVLYCGWHVLEEKSYYFGKNGLALTGWQTGPDDVLRYLLADGTMAIGWTQVGQDQYYFDENGLVVTGWLELENQRYYLGEDGVMCTGWVTVDGLVYYLRENGAMARGHVQIDGQGYFFTSQGRQVLLVNPWNYVPEDYAPELVTIQKFGAYTNMLLEKECYDALLKMLTACKEAGFKTYVVSSYRSQEAQEKNFQRKVNEYIAKGYSQSEAKILAAKVVAVPGTSEHQLGLAVDIVDASWPYLEEEQEKQPAQKWLMEHCWEYGFILRYPKNKTDVTGIIYEPWHYRYVGLELAKELYESGLTLEEYLAALTEE